MSKLNFLVVASLSFICSTLFADISRSLILVKPEAVADNHVGAILDKFEEGNLKIVALKMIKFSREKAQKFYIGLKDKPFYPDLIDYMTSGPIVAAVLEGDNIIETERKIIGSTNPADAASGTIRKLFGKSIQENAVHGSDGLESAKREISLLFTSDEIF